MTRTFLSRFMVCLVALTAASGARAQFPRLLANYPVISDLPNGINAMAQKGGTVYMAGSFTSFATKPLLNTLLFDHVGDTIPDPAIVVPDGSFFSIADGAGGWYLFGGYSGFNNIGAAPRAKLARINADGSLNAWDPQAGFGSYDYLFSAVLAGNAVIVGGSFTAIGSQSYTTPLAALDGTTGQPLPGWNNLVVPGTDQTVQINQLLVQNNTLYVLVAGSTNTTVWAMDISDINHPVFSSSFTLDIGDPNSRGFNVLTMAVAGNTLYLSAQEKDANYNPTYQCTTQSGASFNGALFAVDCATGRFIKSFSTPVTNQNYVQALAIDGNNLYLAYVTNNKSVVKAYDAGSGADISAAWPQPTLPGSYYSQNHLTILSDHSILLYGGFNTMNGLPQSFVLIDPATGQLKNWNPPITNGTRGQGGQPTSITESNGKILAGGTLVYNAAIYPRQGLAAIDALSGAMLPWAPTDLNGTFSTMTISGHTLYVGGSFSNSDGTLTNLAAYDLSDSANPVLIKGITPNPDGAVNALAAQGNTLFAGGGFGQIGSQPQQYLAAFDQGNGTLTLHGTWTPNPDQTVTALTVLNNTLYVGGTFSSIDGSARNLAASFDWSTGTGVLTSWDPQLNAPGGTSYSVLALAAQDADGSQHSARIFMGGSFYQIGANADPAYNFAAVNATTGAQDVWQLPGGFTNGNQVNSLSLSGNKLYAGGQGFIQSTDVSNNFAVLDPSPYVPNANNTNAVLASGNLLFAGGNFPDYLDPAVTGLAVFQLGQLPGSITFSSFSKVYGDSAFTPSATSNNTGTPITFSISAGDNPGNVLAIQGGKVAILRPGTATITASQTSGNGFTAATDVKAVITVSKAILAVYARDTSKLVNEDIPVFSYAFTGWKNGDSIKAGIVGGKPDLTTLALSSSPAGKYAIRIKDTGTLVSDYYNFAAATDTGTLTIIPYGSTPQFIAFLPLSSMTYGDADFDPGAATDATGLSIRYSSSNPAVATIVNGKVHITGAGSTDITASQPGSVTYAPAAPVLQTLTVNKAPLTITADDQARNYGDNNPPLTVTYNGFVKGEDAGNLTTSPITTTTANSGSAPGVYDITVSGASSPNYAITYAAGQLTIRNTDVITWIPVSTLTYGDAPFMAGASSSTGAMPVYTTDNPAVIRVSGSQVLITGAGSAILTATFPAGQGFEQTTSTQTITVQPKPLTVRAVDETRDFGTANPPLTIQYIGFVNGDTSYTPGIFSATPLATTTATPSSPLGAYPITVSGGASTDYSLNYTGGTLMVAAVTRTIRFPALPVKTYGDPIFNAGATSSTGDSVLYTSSDPQVAVITTDGKVQITGAGTTTLTASLATNGSYGATAPVLQTLTVDKAPLTITADDKNRPQGQQEVLLTVSYSGFVYNDNQLNLSVRPILTTTATSQSLIGTYPIIASGAASDNYVITYADGTLTIVPGINGTDNSLAAWCGSRSQLEVKLYTGTAQRSTIQLISLAGQRLLTQESQLSTGLNQYELPVGTIPSGVYILTVTAEHFKLDQKVMVR